MPITPEISEMLGIGQKSLHVISAVFIILLSEPETVVAAAVAAVDSDVPVDIVGVGTRLTTLLVGVGARSGRRALRL